MARIWELRDSVTPYDAAYLAITERLQAVTGGQACLATADRKLARSPAVRCPVELYTTDG
jgi:predicted nucleic acid-binding protein